MRCSKRHRATAAGQEGEAAAKAAEGSIHVGAASQENEYADAPEGKRQQLEASTSWGQGLPHATTSEPQNVAPNALDLSTPADETQRLAPAVENLDPAPTATHGQPFAEAAHDFLARIGTEPATNGQPSATVRGVAATKPAASQVQAPEQMPAARERAQAAAPEQMPAAGDRAQAAVAGSAVPRPLSGATEVLSLIHI